MARLNLEKRKKRARFEVFSAGGGIIGSTYHRKLKNALISAIEMGKRGKCGVEIYDIKKDTIVKSFGTRIPFKKWNLKNKYPYDKYGNRR